MSSFLLGNLIEFQKGKNVPILVKADEKHTMPYLTIDAMENGASSYGDPVKGVVARSDDILVVGDGSRSGLTFYGQEGLVASTVIRIKTKADVIRPKYLYFMSQFKKWSSSEYKKGSTVPHFNYKKLADETIHLPATSEQDKIIAILESVDYAKVTTNEVILKTEQTKRALMQQIFNQDLNRWPVVKLADVAKVQTGIAKNSRISGSDVIELPYLRVANVQDGHLDLSEIKTIKIRASDVNRFKLEDGDVLLTEGGDHDKLGRGFVWDNQIVPCLHQNHVFAVRPHRNLLPKYLTYLTQSPYGKKYFLGVAIRTTNLASINSTKLKEFPVLLPNIAEQEKIVGVFSKLDEKIRINMQIRSKQEELKRGLMQNLLKEKIT